MWIFEYRDPSRGGEDALLTFLDNHQLQFATAVQVSVPHGAWCRPSEDRLEAYFSSSGREPHHHLAWLRSGNQWVTIYRGRTITLDPDVAVTVNTAPLMSVPGVTTGSDPAVWMTPAPTSSTQFTLPPLAPAPTPAPTPEAPTPAAEATEAPEAEQDNAGVTKAAEDAVGESLSSQDSQWEPL